MKIILKHVIVIFFLFLFPFASSASEKIRIGSKKFTESYILAEIMAQKIEKELKIPVERKFGLGGTAVCFEALRAGAIDIYPEYSGTLLETILKSDRPLDAEGIDASLQKQFKLRWLNSFGFNNSYALAVLESQAKALNLEKYSDLLKHSKLRWGLSHEFLNRRDGWPSLKQAYHFQPKQTPIGMEHTLSYEALRSGDIDIIDVYTTDAKIKTYQLRVLNDDQQFFPFYLGAPFVSQSVLERFPKLQSALDALAGKIDDAQMRDLNAQAEEEKKSFEVIAQNFLKLKTAETPTNIWKNIFRNTAQHLKLVFISLFFAGLIGIPLGILMTRVVWLQTPLLYFTGVVQTIPSIALLALMIPLFGIGEVPALVALFLYGLLPIVRNTFVGLREISPAILEAASGIGLRPMRKLRYVEIPLALPTILAGIKTSAVINVGTATLAAFIGAGGLGEPIVTGLALNNISLILQGALPAAALAIIMEFGLTWVEGSRSENRK